MCMHILCVDLLFIAVKCGGNFFFKYGILTSVFIRQVVHGQI